MFACTARKMGGMICPWVDDCPKFNIGSSPGPRVREYTTSHWRRQRRGSPSSLCAFSRRPETSSRHSPIDDGSNELSPRPARVGHGAADADFRRELRIGIHVDDARAPGVVEAHV